MKHLVIAKKNILFSKRPGALHFLQRNSIAVARTQICQLRSKLAHENVSAVGIKCTRKIRNSGTQSRKIILRTSEQYADHQGLE